MKKQASIKRVNLSLPPQVVYLVEMLAARDDVTLTTKAAQLLEQGLEAEEDASLAQIAEQRLQELETGEAQALSAEEFWQAVEEDQASAA